MLFPILTHQREVSIEKKAQPVTPCTAEGLTPNIMELTEKQNVQKDSNSLFTSVSQVNHDKFYEESRTSLEDPILIEEQHRQPQQFQFKIKLQVKGQQNENTKILLKSIDSLFEEDEYINIFFSNQHEKIKVDIMGTYSIVLSFQTKEGFERIFYQKQIYIEEQKGRSNFKKVQNDVCSLSLEIQKLQKYWIKALGLKIPFEILQNFFEERFDLLNQSEKLNSITNISHLKGIFVPLSKQNMGSRIIQKLLRNASEEEINMVICELKNDFKQIITDKYGNYVVQKIFKVSNKNQKRKCLKYFQKYFVDLLFSKAGTFALQGVLDFLQQEDLNHIFDIINPRIVEIASNQFGTHFLQKLVKKSSSQKLVLLLLENIAVLGINKHGVVVQKIIIQNKSSNQILRFQILGRIQNNFEDLVFSEYGHYLIQELLSYYSYYELQNLLMYMCCNVERLSKDQFSSSILKKSMEQYGDYISIPMIQNLLAGEGVKNIMENNSGAFMIHRFLQMTKNEYYIELLKVELIKECQNINCYEKRQKWKKFLNL